MDPTEVITLKRKDFLIHNYLQWNNQLINALLDEHIIGPDQANITERRNENQGKSQVLIDHLKKKGRAGDLTKLVQVLEQTSSSFIPEWHNRWIADEIVEELADHKCELTVDENISHEAATIVHRQFGHGKRLSEHEKKALVTILCIETQKTLNVWKREVERTEQDITYEKELIDFKDEAIRELAKELEEFIEKNKGRLPERNTKLDVGLSQLLRESENRDGGSGESRRSKSPLKSMKEDVDVVSKMLGASLFATEVLDKERSKVLKRVGIDEKEKGHRIKLDAELQNAIDRTAAELASADEAILKKEEQFKKLQEELEAAKQDMTRQLKNKEKNISILMSEVQRAKDKAIDYNCEATELKRKLQHAKGELHDWAERFEMIERGDRINYIYKRDEHMLAKVKAKQRTKPNPSTSEQEEETKDRVKDFEDFEKAFLAKKGVMLPSVAGPRGKKLQHSMSQSRMTSYKAPGTPRSRAATPSRVSFNGRRSRLLTSSNDSHVSSGTSFWKSHTPVNTSLKEGKLDGYQAMEQHKHNRTKRWIQRGLLESQESLEEDQPQERSRSRFSKAEV